MAAASGASADGALRVTSSGVDRLAESEMGGSAAMRALGVSALEPGEVEANVVAQARGTHPPHALHMLTGCGEQRARRRCRRWPRRGSRPRRRGRQSRRRSPRRAAPAPPPTRALRPSPVSRVARCLSRTRRVCVTARGRRSSCSRACSRRALGTWRRAGSTTRLLPAPAPAAQLAAVAARRMVAAARTMMRCSRSCRSGCGARRTRVLPPPRWRPGRGSLPPPPPPLLLLLLCGVVAG